MSLATMANQEMGQYWLARAALLTVTFLASVVIFTISMCGVRIQDDFVRTSFNYAKATIAIFSLGCCFDAVKLILAFVAWRTDAQVDALTISIFGVLASLAMNITHIFIFVLLVRIATCIVLAHTGEMGNTDGRVELASYGSALVLKFLALAIAALSVREAAGPNMDANLLYYLVVSFRSFVCLIAVLVVGRAVQVKYRVRFNERITKVSTLLVVASGIWLLPTTYEVVEIFTFQSLNRPSFKLYFHILEVVLVVWPAFTTLCVILAIYIKKHDGLSSATQTFETVGPATQQMHWIGNYDAPQYVCQHRGPVSSGASYYSAGAAQPIAVPPSAH
ncbi:hypothetical protein B0J13DRAFT_247421 [Dactylonectria estremocensis]|uniref:Uncharacterized protein n=1 Tax=Dactylonectria estremocensis TaxID=1079267 RepID=A0A9P9J5E3_9HYPO|nr:hypothetical protein B0J13DRAFT_247421 [Dactylonectria estremocensis]